MQKKVNLHSNDNEINKTKKGLFSELSTNYAILEKFQVSFRGASHTPWSPVWFVAALVVATL